MLFVFPVRFARSLVGAVSASMVLLGGAALIRAQAPPAGGVPPPPPVAGAAPAGKGSEAGTAPRRQGERDEQVARAREEVRALELQLSAVRAEVKAAELRGAAERANSANFLRLNKKGMASNLRHQLAEMDAAEAEARLHWKQAELIDVENRFERARRRVAAAIAAPAPASPSPFDGLERFCSDLEERIRKLERENAGLRADVRDLQTRLRTQEKVVLDMQMQAAAAPAPFRLR